MLEKGYYNMDCLEALKQFPDNFFDLAIVDPPYGGGAKSDAEDVYNGAIQGRFGGRFEKYILPNKEIGTHFHGRVRSERYKIGEQKINHWDVAPPKEYFDELFRVSKNQIIWGGNYFDLPPTRCFLVWRKLTISQSFTMAMCEYAWTSFNDNAKWIEIAPQGNAKEIRFHPTQKPIKLYTWILNLYAKPGDKILDTHVGSASSLVACHRAGFDFWGFELDPHYYRLSKEWLDVEQRQLTFFNLNKSEAT